MSQILNTCLTCDVWPPLAVWLSLVCDFDWCARITDAACCLRNYIMPHTLCCTSQPTGTLLRSVVFFTLACQSSVPFLLFNDVARAWAPEYSPEKTHVFLKPYSRRKTHQTVTDWAFYNLSLEKVAQWPAIKCPLQRTVNDKEDESCSLFLLPEAEHRSVKKGGIEVQEIEGTLFLFCLHICLNVCSWHTVGYIWFLLVVLVSILTFGSFRSWVKKRTKYLSCQLTF